MFTRLSLRLRIFLFFCLMAAGGAALAGGALYYGWARADGTTPHGPFLTAFLIFAFLNTGLMAAIWLLFDENVAKPIGKLAADLRLRAHSDVDRDVDLGAAKYLGDLAPAASAVSTTLTSSMTERASEIARETERLKSETARLAEVLTEVPVATILANAADEIVLYDGQAAEVFRPLTPLRLKGPLTDYFAADELTTALNDMRRTASETEAELRLSGADTPISACLKPLSGGSYILTLKESGDRDQKSIAARPMVYDFDLLKGGTPSEMDDCRLTDLCFVVFDTETTGLSPQTDDVVQIAAVRVVNGRIITGETFDTHVNPGRPIPAASTQVHGVTDEHVANAPDFAKVGRAFHDFARGSVLVAHNAPFDIAFLKRFEGEMNVVWRNRVLDTVLLSAVCFGTTEQHSLDALCERLSINIPVALRHTALGDAVATAEAFTKLIPVLESRSIDTLKDVIAECGRHERLLSAVDLGD